MNHERGWTGNQSRIGAFFAMCAVAAIAAIWPTQAGALTVAAPTPDMNPIERLAQHVINDRTRILHRDVTGDPRIPLGGLSDGHFDIRVRPAARRILILMPPLRKATLQRTRRMVSARYGRNAPIYVKLAPLTRHGSGMVVRNALRCPVDRSRVGRDQLGTQRKSSD